MIQLSHSNKFCFLTVGTSFLLASQGKALIANGLCVGLLPKVLKREDFQSTLLIIIGGAIATQTLSTFGHRHFSVNWKGLTVQTMAQVLFASVLSRKTPPTPKPKPEPRGVVNYQTIKDENFATYMSENVGETLQLASLPSKLLDDPISIRDRHETTIEVLPQDCLTVAQSYAQRGLNTAVVNFASTQEFGGGFTEGQKGSQEEDICYRSTLGALSMRQLLYPDLKMALAVTTGALGNWNSDRPNKVLFTPGVEVFRDESYDPLDAKFTVGVLSCAAPVRIGRDKTEYSEEEKKLMKALIRTQLFLAHKKGYTAFVSGAFGCGKFGNPPREVATLYQEVLRDEFQGAFEYVAFAILPDAYNATKDNFTPFQEVFGSYS